MAFVRRCVLRVFGLFRRDRIESELADELNGHIDAHVDDNLRAGMTPAQARRDAMLKLGGVAPTRERQHDAASIRWFEDGWNDLRYSIRTLRKAPGFATVAVCTLALGIGANTAMFSILQSVLLRPLSYHYPDRLVAIWQRWTGVQTAALSLPEYLDYSERSRTMAIAGSAAGEVNVGGGSGDPARVLAGYVTSNAFDVLGVQPFLGRGFTNHEDTPGREPVAVLSHAFWQRHLAGDPDIVGKTILIDDASVGVVGVMPPGFVLPEEIGARNGFDVILPLVVNRSAPRAVRGGHFMQVFGRLAAGATLASAQSEMNAVLAPLMREYPSQYNQGEFGIVVRSLRDDRLGPARPLLLILMAAVGLVLLLACANVTNLLLARSESRRHELVVRGALGASRGRIARQLVTEAMLLSGSGAAAGLLVAWLCQRFVLTIGRAAFPRLEDVALGWQVLGFASLLALTAGAIFGVVPALQMARTTTIHVREATDAIRTKVRSALIVTQVAGALTLLVAAGLVTTSFVRLLSTPAGFNAERVLTMRVSLPPARYTDRPSVAGFFNRLIDRVRALPGVENAGASNGLPLAIGRGDWSFDIEGRPRMNGRRPGAADAFAITPGYFESLRIPLRRGRMPAASDTESAPAVVFINETAARAIFPDVDPIGQRIQPARSTGPAQPWRTIAGVVGDVHHRGLDGPVRPEMYIPHEQFIFFVAGEPSRAMSLVIKSTTEPSALVGAVRNVLRTLDPQIPAADMREMEEVVSASVSDRRLNVALIGAFGVLALALAAIGLYGVMAYTVTKRTRELGIRMAIGASRARVMSLIAGQAGRLVGIGLAIGLAASTLLTGLLDRLLYGVPPRDPATFALATGTLIGVAALACAVPVWRATRVDPNVALRAE
jgi:putative ABC transport system permease protein